MPFDSGPKSKCRKTSALGQKTTKKLGHVMKDRTRQVLSNEKTMANATIRDLEGGAALCTWFEGTPSFHDAKLRELELRQGAPGRLVVHTFRMGSEVDAQGYFR